MPYTKYTLSRGYRKFFRIALSHESLVDYFQLNFLLMQEHGYRLEELESMLPWERDIYVGLLVEHLKQKRQQREQQAQR